MNDIIFSDNLTAQEFSILRKSVGFPELTQRQAASCIENTTFLTAAHSADGQIVGMGRCLFDFGYTAYICDIIVHPDFQHRKIGSKIVDSLKKKTFDCVSDGEKVMFVLVAAKNKENFYKKLGFCLRPNEKLGAGMSVWLGK